MIKQESVKKLKESVDILEIVQEYLPNLKRRGKNYFALCPFHSEKTPSFSIAPDKGIIHCFGCGYTADIIKFVEDIEHISYQEAVEKIAKKFNFVLEYVDAEKQKILKEKYDEQQVLLNLLTNLAEVYHNILLKEKVASEARNYLVSRGVKVETIERFKIGFAPEGNFIVKNYKNIKELKDFDLSTLYKAGVINFKSQENLEKTNGINKYEHPYDYFRNRIMFPIFNLSGKVVSFGGRIIGKQKFLGSDGEIPTYLNGPQSVVFNKSSVLYGLYQAKDYIVKEKSIIFVEGYMDVIVLFQEGIKNVVAPLGTALTEQHIKVCKRLLDISNSEIFLMFDPDEAGVDATVKASSVVFSNGGYPQVIILDEDIDPDEYILKHGVEKLKSLIFVKCSVVKFMVRNYLKNRKINDVVNLSINEKLSLLKKLLELTENISQPIIKSEVIKEIAEELKIDERIVRSEQLKFYKKQTPEFIQNIFKNKPYSCEEELLWICVHYPETINEIDEELFSHNKECFEIFKKLKQNYSKNINDISLIIEELTSSSKELFLRIVYDEKQMTTSLEEKIKLLYDEIYRMKYMIRYRELKPLINDMLNEKVSFDPVIFNEFKQIVEILKLGKRNTLLNN
ncbi:MAG: DNA primase [Endomicrobiia bacterium]